MFFKNQIDLEGRLTGQPELKTSRNGTSYCRFSVAYNQARKNKTSGEWESIPHFFNCVSFNKMAENICLFQKGDPVTLSGILQYNSYEKDGEKKHNISILVNDLKKLYITKASSKKSQKDETSKVDSFSFEEEIPFDEIPF